jgi:CheY-like chemotaxis protein
MGLKGRLEDLPLLDMLQIAAFSRKSGFLRIASARGRGAVVLREGRVLFAYSWSTLAGLEDLVRHPEKITVEIIREQIEAALRELGGLREGHFQFELADPASGDFGGVRIQPFLLPEGLDAQELLLDLAVEIDNERREATSLLEFAFQGDSFPESFPAPATPEARAPEPSPEMPVSAKAEPPAKVEAPAHRGPRTTVVVVDDEPPVREVVGEELAKKGYRILTAPTPASGASLVRERAAAGEPVMVVVDLKMPTSTERSFFGGFELIRRVHKSHPDVPTLLMAESLSEKTKLRARELGVRRIAYKPALSKIDQELYQRELREFAATIASELSKLQEDHALPGNGRSSSPARSADLDRVEFLAMMTKKLVEPGASTDVSRLVVEVSAKFLERGLLFVVKGDLARGLAAFGLGHSEKDCALVAQQVTVDIGGNAVFAEVVRRASSYRFSGDLSALETAVFPVIGRGRASEAILIPLLHNRSTLLLMYGDNGQTGRPLGDLKGLELFVAQAGMALENKLLQRKLLGSQELSDSAATDARDAGGA